MTTMKSNRAETSNKILSEITTDHQAGLIRNRTHFLRIRNEFGSISLWIS